MTTRAIYAAFDLYPSAKGSATHITHMVQALFDHFGKVKVFSLGNETTPKGEEEGIVYEQFDELIPNYLERSDKYRIWLEKQLQGFWDIHLAHFRDIWSALAILSQKQILNTLFEVNGLPSIELPYRYKYLSEKTIQKIRDLEFYCLTSSDHIICPSEVIRKKIMDYGVQSSRIDVIPNGADIPQAYPIPDEVPSRYLLYFGALQPWQGIDVLLKAFYLLQDYDELALLICSSQKSRFSKIYQKLAKKLGIDENVIWYYQLEKEQLYSIIQHAEMTVAPLKENSRNISQGCSPIKIFESLANGTTCVASDIPAVREIIKNNDTGKLVRPDRPAELARAIRFLLDHPKINRAIAARGKNLIREKYQWERIRKQVCEIYDLVTIY